MPVLFIYRYIVDHSGKSEDKDIRQIGEFGLISRITRQFDINHDSTLKGIGDDAAVLDNSDRKMIVTTDLLTEGIHFNLVYTPLKHLGYKAAVVNFSDVYAMNARPLHLLVSIGISGRFTTSMVEEIYDGIHLACKQYNVDLVGGDTTSSLTGMVLSCTVIGEGREDRLAYRDGAQKNDLICVSGNLGAAYMGLQVLERERRIFDENPDIQPLLEGYDYVLERQLKPEAREDIIAMLEELAVRPTSMIDISDGLSSELHHICRSSHKGCRVYSDKIPLHPETVRTAAEFHIEPLIAALNGGEDYELLFTIPATDYEKVSGRSGISFIGHITDAPSGLRMVTETGSEIDIEARGWNGFNGPLSRQANP